jgi:hypothetical protein
LAIYATGYDHRDYDNFAANYDYDYDYDYNYHYHYHDCSSSKRADFGHCQAGGYKLRRSRVGRQLLK